MSGMIRRKWFFTVLGFLYGLMACTDAGDLCSDAAPEVYLLKDANNRAPVLNMLWLYKNESEKDSIELQLEMADTNFVKYHQGDFRETCQNKPWACDVYREEIICRYGGSDKLKLQTWISAMSCPVKIKLYINEDSTELNIGDYSTDFDSRYKSFLYKPDSGLVYYKDKTKGIVLKRIK